MLHTSQNTSSKQLPHSSRKPLGEVTSPALICGAVGAVLTVILALLGSYEGLDTRLKDYYMSEPFYMRDSSAWHPVWDWILVLLLTFGVSFAVLDTDKKWRRIMIILLASTVVIFTSPVMMLWDVFWSPLMAFVGIAWSWICSFIYTCQHTMPCELPQPIENNVKIKTDTRTISSENTQP